MKQTIAVKYSCICGLNKITVQVPSREPNQDVVDWMNTVCLPRVMQDHWNKRPLCNPGGILKELLIPTDKNTPIGYPPPVKLN